MCNSLVIQIEQFKCTSAQQRERVFTADWPIQTREAIADVRLEGAKRTLDHLIGE